MRFPRKMANIQNIKIRTEGHSRTERHRQILQIILTAMARAVKVTPPEEAAMRVEWN